MLDHDDRLGHADQANAIEGSGSSETSAAGRFGARSRSLEEDRARGGTARCQASSNVVPARGAFDPERAVAAFVQGRALRVDVMGAWNDWELMGLVGNPKARGQGTAAADAR